jgi:hypothetical protein
MPRSRPKLPFTLHALGIDLTWPEWIERLAQLGQFDATNANFELGKPANLFLGLFGGESDGVVSKN